MMIRMAALNKPYALLLATATYSLVLSVIYITYVFNHSEVVTNTNSPLDNELSKISRNLFQEFKDALGLGGVAATGSGSEGVHEGYRDMTYKPLQLSCSRCAVVSSSGHLLNTSAGPEIDSYPCIFRMNNAPTKGFEKDVGVRTTVRSMGHVNLIKGFANSSEYREEMFADNRTRTDIVLINWMNMMKVDVESDQDFRYALLLAHLYPHVRFFHFTPEKTNQTQELFKNETGIYSYEANTWLSTGWFTMVAAMDICDEITVFGMAYDDYCQQNGTAEQNIPYHYYEPDKLKECQYYDKSETRLTGGHLFITEKAVFENWAVQKKKISFRYPEWPLANHTSNLDTPFLHKFWAFIKEGGNMTELQVRKKKIPPKKVLRKQAPPKTELIDNAKKKVVIMTLQKGNEKIKVNQDDLVDILVELLPDVKLIQTDEYVEKGGDKNKRDMKKRGKKS